MAEDYVEAWADLSVPELREELEARKLPTTGRKPELVARLDDDDARRDLEPEEPEAETAEQSPEEPDLPVEPTEPEEPTDTADPAPEPVSDGDESVPGFFIAEIPLPEDADSHFDLEDPDMRSAQLTARARAEEAGVTPLGGAFCARFLGDDGRTMRFEVPLQ